MRWAVCMKLVAGLAAATSSCIWQRLPRMLPSVNPNYLRPILFYLDGRAGSSTLASDGPLGLLGRGGSDRGCGYRCRHVSVRDTYCWLLAVFLSSPVPFPILDLLLQTWFGFNPHKRVLPGARATVCEGCEKTCSRS